MNWPRRILSLACALFLLIGVCGGRCHDCDDDGDAQKQPAGVVLHVGCHCICQSVHVPEPVLVPVPVATPRPRHPVVMVTGLDQFVEKPEPPPVIVA